MRLPQRRLVAALVLAAAAPGAVAQQVADSGFAPPVVRPLAGVGLGPVVLLDEAHQNFHTASGRYHPFARLLRRDGFVVEPSRSPFTAATLARARVLVIANAIAARNVNDWTLPTPSAFTDAEIGAVREWVRGGGALMLVADHMPFPGAAERLAEALGVYFINGYAADSTGSTGVMSFHRSSGRLGDHPITRGRDSSERIDSVRTFTGQAFRAPGADPLLTLGPGTAVLMPVRAWVFTDSTPRIPAAGLLQGAALRFGRGRVAVFGEAAMFSAQLAGASRTRMGMNAPEAAQNPQFLLNVIRWLAGALPDK